MRALEPRRGLRVDDDRHVHVRTVDLARRLLRLGRRLPHRPRSARVRLGRWSVLGLHRRPLHPLHDVARVRPRLDGDVARRADPERGDRKAHGGEGEDRISVPTSGITCRSRLLGTMRSATPSARPHSSSSGSSARSVGRSIATSGSCSRRRSTPMAIVSSTRPYSRRDFSSRRCSTPSATTRRRSAPSEPSLGTSSCTTSMTRAINTMQRGPARLVDARGREGVREPERLLRTPVFGIHVARRARRRTADARREHRRQRRTSSRVPRRADRRGRSGAASSSAGPTPGAETAPTRTRARDGAGTAMRHGRYRAVSNMTEFQKAFACPAGSSMKNEPMCQPW